MGGHVIRMDSFGPIKCFFLYNLNGTRKVGRLKLMVARQTKG